jgi:glycogen operon protein
MAGPKLGVFVRDGGVTVAIRVDDALCVLFCYLPPDGSDEVHHELKKVTDDIWIGYVPDVPVGSTYGFHVDSLTTLEVDPHARALTQVNGELRGVVIADSVFDWEDDSPPSTAMADSIFYELHVRGLTMLHPRIPKRLRGTYAGLSHPVMIEHLQLLGVTAVELMPVQCFGNEAHLGGKGLSNYWGYNTSGFFAPQGGYAATKDPLAVRDEFKAMVKALHAAGIEVILDVVYNHTADRVFQKLNPSFYRYDPWGNHDNATGCGNTTNAGNPKFVDFMLESLRYWVEEMHVDGFRYDLAPVLGEDVFGFNRNHRFFIELAADPILSQVKHIAEPWMFGSYQLGKFPPPWSEWNDKFRDDARRFWLIGLARACAGEAAGGLGDVAHLMGGSSGVFGGPRGTEASVNFVACHDGYTLRDLVSYNDKHNEANGEDNRDGNGTNHSWNHGREGVGEDLALDPGAWKTLESSRLRSVRNLLGTLFTSLGVPLILAGDEFGRTQHGNNNAYCQDNETSWINWELGDWQKDLLQTTRHLIHLRRELKQLRRREYLKGSESHEGCRRDVTWLRPDGRLMDDEDWNSPYLRSMQVLHHPTDEEHSDPWLLILIDGSPTKTEFVLPEDAAKWRLVWDSDRSLPPTGNEFVSRRVTVRPSSIRIYVSA